MKPGYDIIQRESTADVLYIRQVDSRASMDSVVTTLRRCGTLGDAQRLRVFWGNGQCDEVLFDSRGRIEGYKPCWEPTGFELKAKVYREPQPSQRRMFDE